MVVLENYFNPLNLCTCGRVGRLQCVVDIALLYGDVCFCFLTAFDLLCFIFAIGIM